MNRGEIRQAVYDLGFSGLDTVVNSAINRHYQTINSRRRWPWTEATVTVALAAGADTIPLSSLSNRRAVDAVRLTDDADANRKIKLRYEDASVLRDGKFESSVESGTPSAWTVYDDNIVFDVPADVDYDAVIDYIVKASDFTLDADSPIWPAEYHALLVYAVAADLAMRERDWNMRNAMLAEAVQLLDSMTQAVGIRQRQSPTHVRRSDFWTTVSRYG